MGPLVKASTGGPALHHLTITTMPQNIAPQFVIYTGTDPNFRIANYGGHAYHFKPNPSFGMKRVEMLHHGHAMSFCAMYGTGGILRPYNPLAPGESEANFRASVKANRELVLQILAEPDGETAPEQPGIPVIDPAAQPLAEPEPTNEDEPANVPIADMTYQQLKTACAARGIKAAGSKDELIAKLQEPKAE